MTDGYKQALITPLTVQGDTELMSAPAYYLASNDAPSGKIFKDSCRMTGQPE